MSDVHGSEPEYRFGLFREDGSAKPAAATVSRLFGGLPEIGFNGGFEAAAAAEDGTAVPAVWGSTLNLALAMAGLLTLGSLAALLYRRSVLLPG